MERAAQVLAAHILGHRDLPGALIAGDDLLRPVGNLILAEGPAKYIQASLHMVPGVSLILDPSYPHVGAQMKCLWEL